MIRRTAVHAAMLVEQVNIVIMGAVLRFRTIRPHCAAALRSTLIQMMIIAVAAMSGAATDRPVPRGYVSLRQVPKSHAMALMSGLIRIPLTAVAAAIRVPNSSAIRR